MDEVVLRAAVTWWRSKRPPQYGVIEHIKHPTIGCSTVEEQELARAVAGHERTRMIHVILLASVRRRERQAAG